MQSWAPAYPADVVAAHTRAGWWDPRTVADLVATNRARVADAPAFVAHDAVLSWAEYDEHSTSLAADLLRAGLRPGDVLAVMTTGGAGVHVAYLAAQKAGLVTMGIGPRAGHDEVAHLLRTSRASALLTRPRHRGRPAADVVPEWPGRHLLLDLDRDGPRLSAADGVPLAPQAIEPGRPLGADDVFFLNSTSGTTGRPKCVEQTMNCRKYFGPLAREAGGLGADEVVASVVPPPYGFGQWSAHVVPAMYGWPTVLPDEFDADDTLRLVEEHRVTVLAAVTSQFVMMLNSPRFATTDLSSLRVLFTGGERVPARRAAEFEERTGCSVLQFFGSNEAGPISVTSVRDSREQRLGTAGRPVAGTELRLLDPDDLDRDVLAVGVAGRCAVRGPGLTPGYHRDPEADAGLRRPDGFMLTGDLVTLDADGYLRVTGRATDFIIRGGHNISTAAVEEAVAAVPRVAQAVVVSCPDEVLGERVCAYVVTRDGDELTLAELRTHLGEHGVSKQLWPERLATVASLPLSTGGKVDRARLRADAVGRFGPQAGRAEVS